MPETAIRLLAGLWFGLMWLAGPAFAHVSGYTDSSVQVTAAGVRVIFTTPRDNLLEVLPGGEAGDPGYYLNAVRAGWQVSAGGERCLLSQASAKALDGIASYQYQLTWVCPAGLTTLSLGYGLLFDRWAEHENYTRVFLAGQRMRMRFTAEKRTLEIPVAQLLGQWNKPLAAGFFDGDPHRALGPDGEPRDPTQPRVVEAQASLGGLNLDQLDPGFIRLGFKHIFQGLDHVLFVVGMVLLAPQWRRLLLLITAFTLAHSVTLALATLGLVRFDPALAEPLIAATIIYIGFENLWALRTKDAGPSSTAAMWRRAGLVFLFGLVHGVGFSYALREMGLREDLLGALLLFNVGVELGQLAIVAVSLPCMLWLGRFAWSGRAKMAAAAAVALAGAAMMWTRV